MKILCLNSGSSSLKYAFYEDTTLLRKGKGADVADLLAEKPDAVGHRIVAPHPQHQKIDKELIVELKRRISLAPMHLPTALSLIEAVGDLPQVACFDTVFHSRMPEIAKRYPLPEALGVRRYGFHGLSFESIVETAGGEGRLVIAHLGSGSSLAAVRDGMPIDTTMGFTPTGGIMMDTRSGDLDPGVLIYLMRQHGYDADRLEQLVDKESGRQSAGDELFCYSVRKGIGAMSAALGGLDRLIFTGGIGENVADIRERIAGDFENVQVVPTDEELMIARHTARILNA